MPLHFLTADRELGTDGPTADPPPSYVLGDHWRRPYRLGPWRVAGAALLLLLASYMLLSAMIIALAGTLAAGGTCVVLAALVILWALRSLRMGLWVSPRGLRQVGLFYTTTLKWSQVQSVRTAQQPVRWLGLPRTVQGQAVVVNRWRGDPLRVLLTDHNADFLSRPQDFDRAADVLEAWAAEQQR